MGRRERRQREYASGSENEGEGGRKKRRKRIQLTNMLGFSDQEEHHEGALGTIRRPSGDSTDEETLMSDGPSAAWKTRICYAYRENRCDKGKYCPFAHQDSDLRNPGEARAEWQRKLR